MSGVSLLGMLRECQIPLLAALLIGSGMIKNRRVTVARPVAASPGPLALFPLHLHGPAAAGVSGG